MGIHEGVGRRFNPDQRLQNPSFRQKTNNPSSDILAMAPENILRLTSLELLFSVDIGP